MSPLNVGIVGTGIFANDVHLPEIQRNANLTPYAAYNRTKAKAQAFAKVADIDESKVYDSFDALIKDPKVDVIDALLPVQYNLDTVKTAIAHNKPLCFEKPIAANLEQAKEIVKLSRETELPILVLEQFVYFKSIELIKEKLPLIGEVVSFAYSSTGPYSAGNKYLATGWRQKPEHIGGYLSDGGVHQLALMTEILGKVDTVSALTKQVRELSGADDVIFSTLKLVSGAIGTFTYGSSFGATSKTSYLKIYGVNGSILYDFSNFDKSTITVKVGPGAGESKDEVIEFAEVDGVALEFQCFVDSVTKKDKSLIKSSPDVVFHHLAIVDAALKSSAKGGDSFKVETI